MKKLTISLIVLLALLHQDFWFWNDKTLVFNFIPIGLAYHAMYSLICGIVWAMAVKFLWPSEMIKKADLNYVDTPMLKDEEAG